MKKWKNISHLLLIVIFLFSHQASARFLSPDPVGLVDPATGKINQQMLLNPQLQNRYAYALNNPYKYMDPDGNFPVLAVPLLAAGAWALDAMAPQSTNVSNSKGALDYMDTATMVAPMGAIKNVTKIPKVIKAINSNLSHAAKRAAERGIFSTTKEASEGLRSLSATITKNKQFPFGTIRDTARSDRVLVPVGNKGRAVYQMMNNGKAKLKTTLIDKKR